MASFIIHKPRQRSPFTRAALKTVCLMLPLCSTLLVYANLVFYFRLKFRIFLLFYKQKEHFGMHIQAIYDWLADSLFLVGSFGVCISLKALEH